MSVPWHAPIAWQLISLADYENEGLAWDYNSAGVNHPFRRRIAVLLPELRGPEYYWHFDHVSSTGRLGKVLTSQGEGLIRQLRLLKVLVVGGW